jgi:hypothetical protein
MPSSTAFPRPQIHNMPALRIKFRGGTKTEIWPSYCFDVETSTPDHISPGAPHTMYRTLDTMDIIGVAIVLASLIRLIFF